MGVVSLQAAALAALTLAYVWFVVAARGPHALSGDEPHYLAITQGVWRYHTVDQHRVLYRHDFWSYFPHRMSSHAVHRGAHLYPLHYLGLPLLLLPGFVLGGVTGAQLTIAVIALLVGWRTLRLAARVAGPIPAVLAVGVLGLSAPFVLNAGAIYPDFLSALLVLLAYEALDAPVLTRRRGLALGLALAAMPWVHVKLLVVVVVYLVWAAAALRRQRLAALPIQGARADISGATAFARRRPALESPVPAGTRRRDEARPQDSASTRTPTVHDAPERRAIERGGMMAPLATGLLAAGLPIVSIAALMAFNLAHYGSASPAAPYGHGATLLSANPLSALTGEVLAQGQGALGTLPWALLAVPGMAALWRSNRATALTILAVTLPLWLATLTYFNWAGGDAPPLRFLLPMLPLWSIGIAVLLGGLQTVAARIVAALFAAATLGLSAMIAHSARLGWPLPDGRGALLVALGERLHLPLTDWLPAVVPATNGPDSWRGAELAAAWVAGLLALWAVVAWWERRARGMDRARVVARPRVVPRARYPR